MEHMLVCSRSTYVSQVCMGACSNLCHDTVAGRSGGVWNHFLRFFHIHRGRFLVTFDIRYSHWPTTTTYVGTRCNAPPGILDVS